MFPHQGPGMNRVTHTTASMPSTSVQGISGMPSSAALSGVPGAFGIQHNFGGNTPVAAGPFNINNSNKMWPQTPQQNFKQLEGQNQQQRDNKHRDYLKQQQRLKAMPLSSSKGMSADALIGNLLEKKDTFTPKQNMQGQGKQIAEQTDLVRPQAQTNAVMDRATLGAPSATDGLPGWLIPNSSRLPPIYTHIWSLVCDPVSRGVLVDTNKILALLLTSGLPKEVLGFIWNLATNGANGQLNQLQLYVTLALVALAQMGCTFNNLSVLNFIPTPPIPTFNMNVPKSESEEKAHQSEASMKPLAPIISAGSSSALAPVSSEPPATASSPPGFPCNQHESEDIFADDFTDFQSADTSFISTSHSSTMSSVLPATAVIQPSATAKQVVNELNHSVVSKMGRCQGRSIGSRLANHTLGAPKVTVSQKQRRASVDNDNVYIQDDFSMGFSSNISQFHDASIHPKYQNNSENEDFSDFQIGDGLNVNVDELFPKCHPKPKSHELVLKESAIRNVMEEEVGKVKEVELLAFDSPTSIKASAIELKNPSTKIEPLAGPPSSKPPTKELMSVEEDKYSALRLFELEDKKSSVLGIAEDSAKRADTDDFGDFVSADDLFAEIAVRDIENLSSMATLSSSNSAQASIVQNAEFPVDDWGPSTSLSTPLPDKSLLLDSPPKQTRSTYDDLSSAFSDLQVSKENKEIATDPLPNWNLGFEVGKENTSLNLSTNFSDDSSQNDDDFGDFVGPGTVQTEDSNFTTSSGFLGDQLWTDSGSGKVVPGVLSDNRSVSSLELTGVTLSRHGSLPSLDLNLFPTSDDISEQTINSQVSDWVKSLNSSCSLLQAAASTFTNITSHSVLLEVLSATEGRNYLHNLLEVHRVAWRIQRSYQLSGHESNRIDSILNSIQKVWSTLQTFYKLANIETAVENDGSDEESGQPACGVCGSPASRGVLEYGGHVYHAPCANLWLNCVDRTLPAHSPLL